MKFTCDKDTLLKDISLAHEIISSKNAMSILSNVYLETSGNQLHIKATDLKVSYSTSLPVDVQGEGKTTVFCDKLLGILRNLPAGEIEFELLSNGTFSVRPLFKKMEYSLKSINADKFPELIKPNTDLLFSLDQKTFVSMVQHTIFAVSDDESRYFMNGVYFEKDGDKLRMVATDGRRLSIDSIDIVSDIPEFEAVIIPPKALNLLRKQLSEEGNIQLSIGDKHIHFVFGNQHISSALIDGQFPNYRRVIPQGQNHSLNVVTQELHESLKRVSLLVEKSRRVYMKIQDGSLELYSEENDFGQAREEVACDFQGEETTIALNYSYMIDPIKTFNSESMRVEFTESSKAISLISDDHPGLLHIVMPMQMD